MEDAIEALRDKHLGSVPVTDAKGHYIGYVGALDLLAGLVKSFPQNGNKTPAVYMLAVYTFLPPAD